MAIYEEYTLKKYWTNHCNHKEDAYVCSYETIELVGGTARYLEHKIDMYVYDGDLGTEICLRYGNEPHEYMSAGTFPMVCWSKQEVKKKAIKLLERLGDITWVKKSY